MQEIPLHQIDDMLHLLQWTAGKGFATAEKHVMQPLQMFYGRRPETTNPELQHNLDIQRKLRQWRIVGNIYRNVFHPLAFEADHHPLFRMLNNFLLDLQGEAALRKTIFALEFFKVFEYPVKQLKAELAAHVDNQLTEVFESHEDVHVVVSHSLSSAQREKLNSDAHELWTRIEMAYARDDQGRLSYLLAQFTGRFCNYPEVRYRDEVDEIIQKMALNQAEFRREVRSRLAVRLYQTIARSAEKSDIRMAVRGITTYVMTFQDDLDLPYRRELDQIEEKLYAFIAKHNLWHRVKLQRPENAAGQS